MAIRITIALCFAFFCGPAAGLMAQDTQPLISIQGTLKDANGVAVDDGDQAVIFRLYRMETGGSPVWEESTTVRVTGGVYSHELGSVVPLNAADFDQRLFLAIEVNDLELTPRRPLSYAPYAFSVNTAQKALRIDTAGCTGAVGDVKYSMLNPAQFSLENGDCWVLMDGGDVTGSRLASYMSSSTLPDASGAFLRAQETPGGADRDPNRDENSPVAMIQGDTFEAHAHGMDAAGAHVHEYGDSHLDEVIIVQLDPNTSAVDDQNATFRLPRTGQMAVPGTDNPVIRWVSYRDGGGNGNFRLVNAIDDVNTVEAGEHTHTIQQTGGDETRPVNLNLYLYVRID